MHVYSPLLNFFLIFGLTLSIFSKNMWIFLITILVSILVECDLTRYLSQWSPRRDNIVFQQRRKLKIAIGEQVNLEYLEQDPNLVIFFADLLPWRPENEKEFDSLVVELNNFLSGWEVSADYKSKAYRKFECWLEQLKTMTSRDKNQLLRKFQQLLKNI